MKDIAGVQNQASNIYYKGLLHGITIQLEFSAEPQGNPIAIIVAAGNVRT